MTGDYFVKDYKAGVFEGIESTGPVFDVREGEYFRIEGHIEGPRSWQNGPIIDPPTLTIRVDKNFDNDFLDAGETITHDWNGDSYSGYFDYYFHIQDDGTSPGDGTASNDINFDLTIDGNTKTGVAPALNVAPVFSAHPRFFRSVGPLAVPQVEVRLSLYDQGALDRHKAKVVWADGSESSVPFGLPGATKEISIFRNTALETSKLLPLTLTLEDDDTGSAIYTIQLLDVGVNSDDDNTNKVNDGSFFDKFDDEDIRPLSLASLKNPSMSSATGQFALVYDLNAIRVWESQDKQKLILPYEDYVLGPLSIA